MSYTKTTWADRIDNGNRYSITDNGDGTKKIEYAGEVLQEGTPVNALNLNKIENELEDLDANKVDKVTGKGLSTNDYTTAEKNKLSGLSNYDDSALQAAVANKVDKITGKGLSTNDYTTAEKNKLSGLSNYDDSALQAAVNDIKSMLYPKLIVNGAANTAFSMTHGSRTVSGTTDQNGSAEVFVPEPGIWEGTIGSTPLIADISAPMTLNTAQEVHTVLGENTPAAIQAVAHSGQAANLWSVGDKIGIAMNGKVGAITISGTYYAFIIGFNHNSSLEGSGTIHFLLGMNSSGKRIAFVDSKYNSSGYGTYFNMNTSDTNVGGWGSCYMRTAIMPALKNALPEVWREMIVPCTKYTDNAGGGYDRADSVTATIDDMFLLSEYEVAGRRSKANSYEQNFQQQYDYFANGMGSIFYKYNSDTTACSWWLRSPNFSTQYPFCGVGASDGSVGVYSTYCSLGLVAGFVVA